MHPFFWWLGQCLLLAAGIFFLLFGVYLLIAAYQLDNPFYFVMTFFASNFIILISATLAVVFVLRMIRVYKVLQDKEQPPPAQ